MKNCFNLSKNRKEKYIPVLLVSVAAVIHYVLVLLGVKSADDLFFTAVASIYLFVILSLICSAKLKAVVSVCALCIVVSYFVFIDKIGVPVASFMIKNQVSYGCLGAIFQSFGLLKIIRLPLVTSVGGMRIDSGNLIVGFSALAQNGNSLNSGSYLAVAALSVFCVCGCILTADEDKIIKFLICSVCILTGNSAPAYLYLLLFAQVRYFFSIFIIAVQSAVCFFVKISAVYIYAPSVYEIFMLTVNKIMLAASCALSVSVAYCAARSAASRKKELISLLNRKIQKKHNKNP